MEYYAAIKGNSKEVASKEKVACTNLEIAPGVGGRGKNNLILHIFLP